MTSLNGGVFPVSLSRPDRNNLRTASTDYAGLMENHFYPLHSRNFEIVYTNATGSCILASEQSSNVVWRSVDGGATWNQTAPANGSYVYSFAMSNDGTIQYMMSFSSIFGSYPSYLSKSINSGASWTLVKTWSSVQPYPTFVGCSSDGSIVYVSTSHYAGQHAYIYKSTDYGATWGARITVEPDLNYIDLDFVTVSNDGTKVVCVETDYSSYGSYISLDSGATWVSTKKQGGGVWAEVLISPDGAAILANPNNYGYGCWLTLNGGTSWGFNTTAGYPRASGFVINAAKTKIAYTGYYQTTGAYPINVSTDSGATWSHYNANPTYKSAQALTADSTLTTMYVADVGNIYKSVNSGSTWASVYADCNVCYALRCDSGGTTIYAVIRKTSSSTWWIISSTDSGSTWAETALPNSLNVAGGSAYILPDMSKIYWLDITSVANLALYYSTDLGATINSIALPNNVNPSIGYNSCTVRVSSTGSKIVIGSNTTSTYASLIMSTDSGATWNNIVNTTTVFGVSGAWTGYWNFSEDGSTVVITVNSYNVLEGGAYVSTNNGSTWTNTMTGFIKPNGTVCVSADGSTMYGARWTPFDTPNKSGIYKSTDGGANWTFLRAYPLKSGEKMRAPVCSSDGQKVLVYSTNGSTGLTAPVISTDGGTTWTDVTGLTTYRQLSRVYMSKDGSAIYAAHYQGMILKSTDNGATWVPQYCPKYYHPRDVALDWACLYNRVVVTTTDKPMRGPPDIISLRSVYTQESAAASDYRAAFSAQFDGFYARYNGEIVMHSGSTISSGTRYWTRLTGKFDGLILYGATDGNGAGGYLFRGVHAVDPSSVWTWTQLTNAGSRLWLELRANLSTGTSLIACTSTEAYYSTDSGDTWTLGAPTVAASGFSCCAISSSGSVMYVIETDGDIWKSTDSGASWTVIDVSTPLGTHDWITIDCSYDGQVIVIAGATNSPVYYSTNGGSTWTAFPNSTKNWRRIRVSMDGMRAVGCDTLDVYVMYINMQRIPYQVMYAKYLGGSNSNFPENNSAGDYFYRIVPGSSASTFAQIRSSYLTNSRYSAVVVTTDGATTWQFRPNSIIMNDIFDMAMSSDGKYMYFADIWLGMWYSPNYGYDIYPMPGIPALYPDAVMCSSDGSIVYAVDSNDGNLYKSTNYGSTSSVVLTGVHTSGNSGNHYTYRHTCSGDGQKVVAKSGPYLGFSSIMRISTDAGATWTPIIPPDPYQYESAMVRYSRDGSTLYYLPTSGQGVYKSINDGASWTLTSFPHSNNGWGYYDYQDFSVSDNGQVVALLDYNSIYVSKDAGASFFSVCPSMPWTYSNGFQMTSIAVSGDGTRLLVAEVANIVTYVYDL